MEDEIDLQRYFLLLIDNWKWIVGISFMLAVMTALVTKFLLSPIYQAKALAVITQPRYSLTFDPKFETETRTDLDFYVFLTELAKSDDLMVELLDAVSQLEGVEAITLPELQSITEARAGKPTNFVELLVTFNDPQAAAQIVNLWAELFVAKANDIYSGSINEPELLDVQLAQVEVEQLTAEQALIDFESQNELLIFKARLASAQGIYTQFLKERAKLEQIVQDIESLQAQLASLPANDEVSFENELTVLLLQLKAFNVETVPIQLDLSNQVTETRRTVRELDAYLDELATVLRQKSDAIDLKLDPLKSQVLALQSQIKTLEITSVRLAQAYQIASDTHLTLARKVEETQISNEFSGGTVKLASYAAAPIEPIGPRAILNTLIAGIVGLTFSIFGILLFDFWKQISDDQVEDAPSPNPSQA